MDKILKDLEDSRDLVERIMQNPTIAAVPQRRKEANKLKECLSRAYNRIQDYKHLASLDKAIDAISNTLKEEKPCPPPKK